jgi:CRP-like cAMP-binding protein
MRARRLLTGNRLLDRLPPAGYRRLDPWLERRRVAPSTVLQPAARPIRHVYFVASGLFSEVIVFRDAVAEVALVGSEGMLGSCAWLGARRAPTEWRSHTAGEVLRISAERLRVAAAADARLRRILDSYAAGVIAAAAHTAACSGVHSIEQRLARWLLTAADRNGGGTLALSHLTIARMLGVRRAGVSELLARWSRRRIVAAQRASIRILDRARLRRVACRCYAALHRTVSLPR